MANPTIDAGKKPSGMIQRRGDKTKLDIIAKTEVEVAAVDVKLTGSTNTTIAKPKFTTRLATVADPGDAATITPPVGQDFSCSIVTAGAETRVLGTPDHVGQRCYIIFLTDGGDFTMTNASGWKDGATADDVATFDDAGDAMECVALAAGAVTDWRVSNEKGVAFA